jgi:hypothetical protein
MKYVMVDKNYPIVFPDHINHSDFMRVGKITSAGFVSVRDRKVHVHGKSVSLKLGPEKGDNLVLSLFLTDCMSLVPFLDR